MHNEDNIELLIWDYIDGNLNEEERNAVDYQIKNDTHWGNVYTEFMSLNSQLSATNELTDPPLRFTKNVMEQIVSEQIVHTKKVYINPYIIKGIAAIFISTITIPIIYLLYNTNWSHASDVSYFDNLKYVDLPKLNVDSIFSSSVLNIIICVNVILLLALLDTFLFRKNIHQS
jgi:hypothetical protein